MIDSQLALTKTLLDTFVMADVYEEGDAIEAAVCGMLDGLDEHESQSIVPAFKGLLQVLEGDLLRWRAAGDLLVRLDVYEVAPALLEGLRRQPDVHQAANLAVIISNPGVSAELRKECEYFLGQVQAPTRVGRLIQIRLGNATPETELEKGLHAQMWPGGYAEGTLKSMAPLVYVSLDSPSNATVWHAVSALARAGARVRRVPPSVSLERRAWATPDAPYVHWSGNAVAVWRQLTGDGRPVNVVLGPDRIDSPVEAARLVNRVQDAFPPGVRLRRRARTPETLPQAFAPDTLDAGAYDAPEMAYLGAASRTSLHRFAKDGLLPTQGDVQRWRFSQLVAVRLVVGFRLTGVRYRRQPTQLVQQLTDIASASAMHRVGLGADGDVYIDDGSGFRNTRTNQQTLEPVLAIDDAFRPFELGGGKVPDLLRPGRTTTVHPLTLGGTPCVEGRRVSARALAIAVHGGSPERVLRSAYPELSAAELGDAVQVGEGILAK